MSKNLYDILKNNIIPNNIDVLTQITTLSTDHKKDFSSASDDIHSLEYISYNSWKLDVNRFDSDKEYKKNYLVNDFIKKLDSLEILINSWLVKIWRWCTIPNSTIDEEKNIKDYNWLKIFDSDFNKIKRYILKHFYKSNFQFDNPYEYTIIASYRSWQMYWSISRGCYSLGVNWSFWFENVWYFWDCIDIFQYDLKNPLNDKLFKQILELYNKKLIKFWIIPIISAKSKKEIIKKSCSPIAIDIINMSDEQLIDLYRLANSEDHYLDIRRIVFIWSDNQWPKYWLPSKSRLYYSKEKILDNGSIITYENDLAVHEKKTVFSYTKHILKSIIK